MLVIELGDGTSVGIEAPDAGPGVGIEATDVGPGMAGFQETAIGDKAIRRASDALNRSLATVISLGKQIRSEFTKAGEDMPNEVELQLGIKLSAEGGISIAKVSSDAQLAVKFTWRR